MDVRMDTNKSKGFLQGRHWRNRIYICHRQIAEKKRIGEKNVRESIAGAIKKIKNVCATGMVLVVATCMAVKTVSLHELD